jgi:IS4 transposase
MLGEIFQRFVEKSPIAVMVRGLLERVLGAEQLDAWYEQTAQKQYTRTLLFSTVYDLLSRVVFTIKPSVHAAYQELEAEVGASVVSVYNKLQGVEPRTSAELVRYSAQALAPIIDQLDGGRVPWLPGYVIKILDGHCLEATEHRLKELRTLSAGALPGKSLVVFDPALGLVVDVFPCEDGHAQERSLLSEVLPTIQAGEVWLQDRNFCTRDFLCGIAARGAFFITREHQKLSREVLSTLGPARRIETGKVAEHHVRVRDHEGNAYTFRRIRLELDEPTRDGEWVIYILTNLPRQAASAKTVARLYGKRWTIETAFQELEG